MYGSYFANALSNDNVKKSSEIEETRVILEENVGKFSIPKLTKYFSPYTCST